MDEPRRILVIEDDPILRELMSDWLLAAGYRVAVAPGGESGIVDAKACRPDLVVTDINMPGTGGAAVIARLARIYPGLPIIAISAHFKCDRGLAPGEATLLGAARTLAKPFRRAEMVGAVRELIGTPAA
ncbi:MAG TPA: response regulator [Usitatibacter sp.]|nr:response regulator [Usitatibacter sp.]